MAECHEEKSSHAAEAKEAEQIKKDRILEAKEKFLNLREEHERAVNKRDQQLAQRQNSFREKDERLKHPRL